MRYLFFFLVLVLVACSKEDIPPKDDDITPSMYFPPTSGNNWETSTFEDLGWNETAVPELENYLELNETRAFITLVNGRIVMEKYWNMDITNTRVLSRSMLILFGIGRLGVKH